MIDTAALRKKVINLAMQGKITQQLPEDGNAEDLYKKIQEEKARLIKEGKIKKEKPLPLISEDEIPFEIPRSWKWTRLNTIIRQVWAGGDKPSDFVNQKSITHFVPVVGNGVNDDGILGYTTVPKADSNTITIAARGTIGFCVLREYEYYPIVRLIVIQPSCLIDPKFLFFSLKSLSVYSVGSSIPQLTVPMVKPKLLPLPPLAEQKRIVEKIEETFSQIDIIDTLQQQYESDREILKGKIIDAGIRGKLTEQLPEDGNAEDLYAQIQEEKAKLIKEGKIKKEKPLPPISEDEIPFEIPSNWKWYRIGEVYNVVMGQSPPGTSVGVDIDGLEFHQGKLGFGQIYLNRSEQKTNEITKIAVPGDVLLCVRAPVGVANITDREICIGRGLCAISSLSKMNPLFLFYYLFVSRKVLEAKGTGSTFSAINLDVVRNHFFPLPPLAEQKRIVDKIDALLVCIETV